MFKNIMNFFMICVDLSSDSPNARLTSSLGEHFFIALHSRLLAVWFSTLESIHLISKPFFSFSALSPTTTPPFHLIVDFFNYFFFLLGTVLLPMLFALLFFSCPLERHSHNREWNFRFFFLSSSRSSSRSAEAFNYSVFHFFTVLVRFCCCFVWMACDGLHYARGSQIDSFRCGEPVHCFLIRCVSIVDLIHLPVFLSITAPPPHSRIEERLLSEVSRIPFSPQLHRSTLSLSPSVVFIKIHFYAILRLEMRIASDKNNREISLWWWTRLACNSQYLRTLSFNIIIMTIELNGLMLWLFERIEC